MKVQKVVHSQTHNHQEHEEHASTRDMQVHIYWLIWTSPTEGTFKLNVYGSFLEDSLCLGASGVIQN